MVSKGLLTENTTTINQTRTGKDPIGSQLKQSNNTLQPLSPPRKSRNQLNPENWERQTPNKCNMDHRLNEASQRRQVVLSEIASKARNHCDEVAKVLSMNNTKRDEEVNTLASQFTTKADIVEENKENSKREYSIKMQQKMEKISNAKEMNHMITAQIEVKVQQKMAAAAEHKENIHREYSIKMQEKMSKISRMKEIDNNAKAEIAERVQKKIATAEQNKEMLQREHSIKVQEKMAKVARLKEIDNAAKAQITKKIEEKMAAAEENKLKMQLEYSTKMQEKMVKISQAKKMDLDVKAEIAEKVQKKMAAANENKQSMQSGYSAKMQKKMEKISQVKEHESIARAQIEEKVQKKMTIVEENKLNIQHEHSIKMKEKMGKIYCAQEHDLVKQAEIEEKIQKKLEAAVQRKSKIVAENIKRVSSSIKKKRKRVEQRKHFDDTKAQEIHIKQENKLLQAAERKSEALSNLSSCTASSTKKGLERVHLYKLAQDADLSSLKKKLEDKMDSVSTRKKETIAMISSKAAVDNQLIAERTKEIINQREVNARETLCKHENKLMGADKRKQRLQDENSSRKERQNLRREKVLENNHIKETVILPKAKECLQCKLDEAASRRSLLLMQKVITPKKSALNDDSLAISPPFTFSASSPLKGKCLSLPAEEESTNSEESCDSCNKAAETVGIVANNAIFNIPNLIWSLISNFFIGLFKGD